ncbi:MAG: B12-binding domain-containing radical SAM protein [Candidatus Omnitrophica bacterium]|nr:B12-binding domain-containing radical SAM protein [Candidatus Omnitrophota bacterium]
MKIVFVYGAFENLGIEYLSAVLKLHGHSTRLAFDPKLFDDPFIKIRWLDNFFNYEKIIVSQIVDYHPDIVAFSVVSSEYNWAVRLAQRIKERLSLVHITFGGIHPSSVPEEVLKNNCIDSVIIGEGEYSLLELVNSLQKRKIDYSIKNIWFRYNGKIIKNPLSPYIDDLDTLPFPDKELYYEIIPGYKNGYTIITRRGCINSCSYCHNSIWQALYPGEKKIRLRSVQNVIAELKLARKRYNFKRLRINDDLFTYNEQWLKEFSKEYKKCIDVPIYCFSSPSTINENIVRCLKDIKCYQLCLGVQSTSPFLREKILNRKENNEQVSEVINLCRRYKIRCVVDNIIGLPQETEKDLIEMAKFYNKNRPHRICIFWLIYFPKTPIINSGLKEGILTNNLINKLEKNPCTAANTLQNELHPRNKIKYHWLLLILHFLPPMFYNWLIHKKLYRFLPLFNPAVIEAPLTMLTKDRLDIPRKRYYVRYFYFVRRIMMIRLKNGVQAEIQRRI